MPTNQRTHGPRVARDELPTPSLERAVCSRCGSELTFNVDWLGYAIERCRCGYSKRILPTPPEPPRRTLPKGAVQAAVLAAIPLDAHRAPLSAREISMRTGLAMSRVTCSLRHLTRRRLTHARQAPRTAAVGRMEISLYWRAA